RREPGRAGRPGAGDEVAADLLDEATPGIEEAGKDLAFVGTGSGSRQRLQEAECFLAPIASGSGFAQGVGEPGERAQSHTAACAFEARPRQVIALGQQLPPPAST